MEEENSDHHHHQKKAKGSILKKLERFLTFDKRTKSSSASKFTKSRSWHSSNSSSTKKGDINHKKAPTGCFSVYVGPEKQRFFIKTEFVNHSLFKMLLEDAELEYGFNGDGPLRIPCEVDLFCRVLAEMECSNNGDDDDREFNNFGFGCSPLFSPGRRFGRGGGGTTGYALLTPPRLLKINHF